MGEPNSRENTPEHCWSCWKFGDCHQAQNTSAGVAPEDVYYGGDGDLYCGECAPEESEYVGDQETDCPSHCGGCGVPLVCHLTDKGMEYVRERLAEGGGCTRELWPELFPECVGDGLKSSNPELREEVLEVAEEKFGAGTLSVDYEHGQWWVTILETGAQYSVVDAEGGDSIDGYDFEQVTLGEEE